MKSVDREGLEKGELDKDLARDAVEGLKTTIAQIDKLGISVPELNEMLQNSIEAFEGLSDANLVPSFSDAAKIALKGTEMGQDILASHRVAADAIKKAEELIRQEFSNQGDIHGNVFQHLILSPSLDLLKESKRCLKNRDFERVRDLLERLRALPRRVKEQCQENAEVYRYCEKILDDLKREGVRTDEVEDILRISRTAFLNGRFERVKELSEVIEEKAIELRERHRGAVRALKRAKRAAISMEKINAVSEEVDEQLVEACLSMKEGNYEKCTDLADKAAASANEVCRRFKKLIERIDVLKRELRRIGSSGVDVPEDIDEMIARAESELRKGNHQGSQAEVEIASLLLDRYEAS